MSHSGRLSAEQYVQLIPQLIRQTSRERPRFRPSASQAGHVQVEQRRCFHDYFVSHIPSSSLHPDSRAPVPKLPSSQNKQPLFTRDTTTVRIPLRSARHHYGATVSRGSRPYNEDSHQAGVIELPAFARRPPKNISDRRSIGLNTSPGSTADPQVFYFGVFDGHGGAECSAYLKENLHSYIERTAHDFRLESSLNPGAKAEEPEAGREDIEERKAGKKVLKDLKLAGETDVEQKKHKEKEDEQPPHLKSAPPVIQDAKQENVRQLEEELVANWKKLVGGYFRRFKPAYFSIYGSNTEADKDPDVEQTERAKGTVIEEIMTYAFLKADYEFVSMQVRKEKEAKDLTRAEKPINDEDHILGRAPRQSAKAPTYFKGGSTCSVAVVSTPTPTPFWNPSTPSSLLIAHVGDTRVILCETATGEAIPLTTDHHPSSPIEATRLRRYAATFVTDSFGEERISGLANTRAFGDVGSKRIGVSAEPEIRRVEIGPAQYSFMILVSDGVTGTLNDQEIVDIAKEAKTPEQASRDIVDFATEVSEDGDNATCMVVRLGGWERRQEGGKGSLGTKEGRAYKRETALDPRAGRR